MKKAGKVLSWILAGFLLIALIASYVVDKAPAQSVEEPEITEPAPAPAPEPEQEQGYGDYNTEDGKFDEEAFNRDYPEEVSIDNTSLADTEKQIALYEDMFITDAKSLGTLKDIATDYNKLNNTYTMTAAAREKDESRWFNLGLELYNTLNIGDCACRTRLRVSDAKGIIFEMENTDTGEILQ